MTLGSLSSWAEDGDAPVLYINEDAESKKKRLAAESFIPSIFLFEGIPLHFEGGIAFNTGEEDKSLTGANSIFGSVGIETIKRFITGHVNFEFTSSSGTAVFAGEEATYRYKAPAIAAGIRMNPWFYDFVAIQPFIGIDGIASYFNLYLPTQPGGLNPNYWSRAIGYEASIGVDFRLFRKEKKGEAVYVRVRSGYWTLNASAAGQSSFKIQGFRFATGFVF
jgi:hypothetical protein